MQTRETNNGALPVSAERISTIIRAVTGKSRGDKSNIPSGKGRGGKTRPLRLFIGLASLAAIAGTAVAQNPNAGPPTANVVVTNPSLPVTASAPLPVTATAPLPVTLVSPPSSPTVTCKASTFGSSNDAGKSIVTDGSWSSRLSMTCPVGTTAINVRRIVHDPEHGAFPAEQVSKYRLMIGFAGTFLWSDPNPEILGVFTDSAPEKTLSETILIDLAAPPAFSHTMVCSSGIATVSPTCALGTLYFIGTRVR